MKNQSIKNARLGIYLTGIGGFSAVATTSDAAIVVLDVSSISGPNAGLAAGAKADVSLSTLAPGLAGTIGVRNQYVDSGGKSPSNNTYTGLVGEPGDFNIAIQAAFFASPRNFTAGELIDNTAAFTAEDEWTVFEFTEAIYSYYYGPLPGGDTYQSPAFGPGSYIGFRDANSRFGWLEVTWDPGSSTFEILAGAYETELGVGITAGAIPEPSRMLLLVLGVGAACGLRRRSKAGPVADPAPIA